MMLPMIPSSTVLLKAHQQAEKQHQEELFASAMQPQAGWAMTIILLNIVISEMCRQAALLHSALFQPELTPRERRTAASPFPTTIFITFILLMLYLPQQPYQRGYLLKTGAHWEATIGP